MTAYQEQTRDDDVDEDGPAFDVVHVPDAVVVTVRGEIDEDSRAEMRECVERIARAGVERIVFDLSGLGFADSSLLNLLIRARMLVLDRGGEVRLVGPLPPMVVTMLEVTGVGELFRCFPGVEAALEGDHV